VTGKKRRRLKPEHIYPMFRRSVQARNVKGSSSNGGEGGNSFYGETGEGANGKLKREKEAALPRGQVLSGKKSSPAKATGCTNSSG